MKKDTQANATRSNANVALAVHVRHFEGHPIHSVELRGQHWWPGRRTGRIVGSGDDGQQFVRNVTEGDGVEGVDFIHIAGDEAAAVSAALLDDGDSPSSKTGRGGTRRMTMLSESGLNLALIASRSDLGKRMRLWLARDVIPAIRATGRYEAPRVVAAGPGVKLLEADNARLRKERDAAQRRADDERADRVRLSDKLLRIERDLQAGGLMGRMRGALVAARIQSIAGAVWDRKNEPAEWKAERTMVERDIRRVIVYRGRWSRMSLAMEDMLTLALESEEAKAKARRAQRDALKQITIFDVVSGRARPAAATPGAN